MRRTARIRAILAGLVLAVVCVAIPQARAHHVLEAEHVPPTAAVSNRPLELNIAVASSCPIAYCGWIQATAHYELGDGTRHSAYREVVYGALHHIVLTIPAIDIRPPLLTYVIEVEQQSCLGDCHDEHVHLPRFGARYEVRVVAGTGSLKRDSRSSVA